MSEELISYLLTSWHHVLVLVVAGIMFIVHNVMWYGWGKGESLITQAILIVVCLIAFDSVNEGYQAIRKEKLYLSTALHEIEEKTNNKYAKSFLSEVSGKINQSIDNKTIETTSVREGTIELIRAMDTAEDSLIAINHYIEGWNEPELEEFYTANLEAIGRKVNITRIFILRDDVLLNPKRLQIAIKIMDRQKNDKINILVALECEIRKERNYEKLALSDCGLYDKKMLGYDMSLGPGQKVPGLIGFTWDPKQIKKRSPFKYILKSKYVKEYTDETRESLLSKYLLKK